MKKNGKYCQFSLLKCYFCRFSDLIISIPKIKYLHILKRTIGANRWQARTKGCSKHTLDQWVSTVLEMNDLEMQVIGLLLPFTGLRVKEFIHFHGPTWLSWKGDGSDTTYGEIPVMKVPARANCFVKKEPTVHAICAKVTTVESLRQSTTTSEPSRSSKHGKPRCDRQRTIC